MSNKPTPISFYKYFTDKSIFLTLTCTILFVCVFLLFFFFLRKSYVPFNIVRNEIVAYVGVPYTFVFRKRTIRVIFDVNRPNDIEYVKTYTFYVIRAKVGQKSSLMYENKTF